MPTKEQIERFIKAADVELGPECQDDWVEECRKILRGGDVERPIIASATIGTDTLRGAIARGWCHSKNSHKEMDPDLAEAIYQEVSRLLIFGPPSNSKSEG